MGMQEDYETIRAGVARAYGQAVAAGLDEACMIRIESPGFDLATFESQMRAARSVGFSPITPDQRATMARLAAEGLRTVERDNPSLRANIGRAVAIVARDGDLARLLFLSALMFANEINPDDDGETVMLYRVIARGETGLWGHDTERRAQLTRFLQSH